MSKGPRRWVKRRQRWIIIFEGPTGDAGAIEEFAELAVRSKPFPGTVYPSANAARKKLFNHEMARFATWLLNLEDGDTEAP